MESNSQCSKKINTTFEDDYYVVFKGPNNSYRNHNQTNISIITDGNYENVYRIESTNSTTMYSGIYLQKKIISFRRRISFRYHS